MKRSMAAFLGFLFLSTLAIALRLHAQSPAVAPRVIELSAKRFEFTPNQLTLVRGEPVTLRVSAQDRDHGFFQKELHIALDLTTAKVAEVTIRPEKAGR
jgi:cytochrome c oxidase subunit 2